MRPVVSGRRTDLDPHAPLNLSRGLRVIAVPGVLGQLAAFVARGYGAALWVQLTTLVAVMLLATALLGPVYERVFPAQRTTSVRAWPQLTSRGKGGVIFLAGMFWATLLGFAAFLAIHGQVGPLAFNLVLSVIVIEALALLVYVRRLVKRRSPG